MIDLSNVDPNRMFNVLAYLADENNWTVGFEAFKEFPLVYGHDQPWELARDVIGWEQR